MLRSWTLFLTIETAVAYINWKDDCGSWCVNKRLPCMITETNPENFPITRLTYAQDCREMAARDVACCCRTEESWEAGRSGLPISTTCTITLRNPCQFPRSALRNFWFGEKRFLFGLVQGREGVVRTCRRAGSKATLPEDVPDSQRSFSFCRALPVF